MPENEREQKYRFLLVFLQFCGLRGTSKYSSLADVRSAIYYPKPLISLDIVNIFSLVVIKGYTRQLILPFIAKLLPFCPNPERKTFLRGRHLLNRIF